MYDDIYLQLRNQAVIRECEDRYLSDAEHDGAEDDNDIENEEDAEEDD
jgi:hypothetical protein